MNFEKLYLVKEKPTAAVQNNSPLQPVFVSTSFEPSNQVKQNTEYEMSQLQNSEVAPDIRAKLYTQALQRRTDLKQAPVWTPPPTPLTSSSPAVSSTEKTLVAPNPTLDIVQNLPNSMRPKAKHLLDWLERYSGRVSWNHLGNLILDGQTHSNTNIVHLLYHVLSPRPSKSREPPLEIQKFTRMLSQINVPENLIANKTAIKMMREVSPLKQHPVRSSLLHKSKKKRLSLGRETPRVEKTNFILDRLHQQLTPKSWTAL